MHRFEADRSARSLGIFLRKSSAGLPLAAIGIAESIGKHVSYIADMV